MKDKLLQAEQEALEALASASDLQAIDLVRTRFIGRKGVVTQCLRQISTVPPEDRPAMGKLANEIKKKVEAALQKAVIRVESDQRPADAVDITLPGRSFARGHLVARSTFGFDENCVFASGPDIFDCYGVDAKQSRQVLYIVRPDNYIAWRSSGFDFDACHQFLSEFGVSPTQTVQLSASM